MKRKLNLIIKLCSITFFLSACSWVTLTPEGEKVKILPLEKTSECKKMGKTTVSLKAKVGIVKRRTEKVKLELETLAKNSAARMEANTASPSSEIVNGEQTFTVFNCEPN